MNTPKSFIYLLLLFGSTASALTLEDWARVKSIKNRYSAEVWVAVQQRVGQRRIAVMQSSELLTGLRLCMHHYAATASTDLEQQSVACIRELLREFDFAGAR